MRDSLCAWLGLLTTACFGEAPPVDAPTTTDAAETDGSDSTAVADVSTGDVSTGGSSDTGDTGGSFCAGHVDALFCDDFESGAWSNDWRQTIGMADAIEVTSPGRDSMYAASVEIGATMNSIATLHHEHGLGSVVQTFAINIAEGCTPEMPGMVLASFSTFAAIDLETTSLEVVLLPGDLLALRRRLDLEAAPEATIVGPPRDTWVTFELEVNETPTGFDTRLTFGDETIALVFVGLGAGNGRRSSIGLLSPGAPTECAVMYDDVLIVGTPG